MNRWKLIEGHSGHSGCLVGCLPKNGEASKACAAFLDVTNVWRVLYSKGGMAPVPFTPTHFQALPSGPQ